LFLSTGSDVIFLDPHTTQQIGMLPNKDIETEHKIDHSYHCQQINRLPILSMDPSLAAVSTCNLHCHMKLFLDVNDTYNDNQVLDYLK